MKKSDERRNVINALTDIRLSLSVKKIKEGPTIKKSELRKIIDNVKERFDVVKEKIDLVFEEYFPTTKETNYSSLDDMARISNERYSENDGRTSRVKVKSDGHFNSSSENKAA